MQRIKGIVENAPSQGSSDGAHKEYACDAPFPKGKEGHLLLRFRVSKLAI
jgi:hypothetical protein